MNGRLFGLILILLSVFMVVMFLRAQLASVSSIGGGRSSQQSGMTNTSDQLRNTLNDSLNQHQEHLDQAMKQSSAD